MKLNLQLACNDYRNGMGQGWFESAHIFVPGGDDIELHGSRVVVRECHGNRLKIGRVSVHSLASKDWYGNWCWNGYAVSDESLRRVANYLKGRGWACEVAPTEIFERWREPGEIKPDEWAAMIGVSA